MRSVVLKRTLLLPIALRLALMLGTLAAIQLTYVNFTQEMFVAVNMLTFLVGLHTALSYSVQVEIWETGRAEARKIVGAIAIAVVIILLATLFGNVPPAIMIGGLAYILYRFSDRLSFNTLITRGKVARAYCVSILAIAVEISAFCLLVDFLPENLARLLVPSLLAGAIPMLVLILLSYGGGLARSASGSRKHDWAFAGHSLAILFVVMIDRIAPSVQTTIGYLDARYLLMFSYAGAIYSIGVAVLEPLRPRYFATAKEVGSLGDFLAATGVRMLALPVLGIMAVSAGTALAVSAGHGFADPQDFSKGARDLLIGGGLLVFFSLFLLLAYVQTYFLSRRQFGTIFLSWAVAFAVRLMALTLPRLDLYLAFSSLAAVSAIAVFFVAEARKSRILS